VTPDAGLASARGGVRPGLRLAAWALVAAYLALIFYLSSLPNPLPELTTRMWDKALHAIEYGGLGLLLSVALIASGLAPRRALVAAAVCASLYGASDEVHQAFVPNRSSDVRDWCADTCGGALGAVAMGAALRVRGARASIRRAPREVP
jgi:VanZ family protein